MMATPARIALEIAYQQKGASDVRRLLATIDRVPSWKGDKEMSLKTELTKCKTCDEQIDRAEHDCDYCEDCCHELQMSWQVDDVS